MSLILNQLKVSNGITLSGSAGAQLNGNGSTLSLSTSGNWNSGVSSLIQLQSSNMLFWSNGGSYFFKNSAGNDIATLNSTNGSLQLSLLRATSAGNVSGGTILMGPQTNNAAKWSNLCGTHYANTAEPEGIAVIGCESSATANRIAIGGGIWESNPATEISFYTYTATTHNLGGSLRMTIDTNGNVCIGQATAISNCRLSLNSGNTARFGISDGTVTSNMWATSSTFYISTETNHPMVFITNANERLRIAAGGAVGIDETNPLAKLQITKNDGDNGSGPYNHYGLLVTSNSSQATMGVMVTADTYSNLNLGSTVSSVKRFWHISKRIASDSHRLEYFYFDGSNFNSRIRFETGGNFQVVAGQVQDQYGDLRTLPENAKTAAYTLAASDTGRLINITTGGITVPASVFSIGQVVTIYNNSASNQTITQGASVTMYLSGTATTGNRTLAQRGVATVICVASNTFVISGSGLT